MTAAIVHREKDSRRCLDRFTRVLGAALSAAGQFKD
jgi:hypothetical protein